MTRDYRYGHKSSAPAPRRSQQSDEAQVVAASADSKVDNKVDNKPVKPFSSVIRRKPKPTGTAQSQQTPRSATTTSDDKARASQSSRDRALDTYRKTKSETNSSVSKPSALEDDVQKVKNKAYRESLPKHIRKELEAQEAYAKAQAEQAEQARLAQLQAQKEKRRQRLSLGGWLSIAGLTLVGFAWLLYAPFFLAFAFEMGWVSEETRNRLDPAASMRSELASKVIEPVKKPAPNPAEVQAEDPNAVKYTFYGELPKDVVLAGVQPITVKTKAPVYLQLLSLTNPTQVQEERRRLQQKGYQVQMATLAGKSGNAYVLRMGPYDDQRTLNRLKVELQKLGLDPHEVSLASVVKASEPVKNHALATTGKTQTTTQLSPNSRGAVAPR